MHPATPNYDELNALHNNLFKSFGEMKHYLDTDYHPRLSRKEVVRIMAEIEATAKAMTSPLVALCLREIESGVWNPHQPESVDSDTNHIDPDKYDGVPADTHSV